MSPFLGTRGAGSNRAFGYAGAAAPAQVTGLTATDFGTSRAYNNGRIDLSWTAPANNGATISGYLIQRSTDGSSYSTLVANTGSSATTYSDTSLLSNQIYYYKVSAINAAGTGLASSAANATSTTVPQAPTVSAANVGTGRAYNNGAATVTVSGGATGGKTISSYTATSSPGSFTATSGSPLTVTGLQSATAYTFSVTATNANGTSTATVSNSITATTVPQAPTIGTATAGIGSATVTYTANATGGAAVSTFTATSSPGSFTGTGSSPITVSGLSSGTSYTFTVTATNANGTSAASSASNSITPVTLYTQTFTSNGTWTRPAGVNTVEVLVVAGGGGGGAMSQNRGGGGGAGGLVYNSSFAVSADQAVTIGAGGNGYYVAPKSSPTEGTKGGNSTFGSITANGGGRGCTLGQNSTLSNGGSGGGAINNGCSVTGPGTASQGYGGGTAGGDGSTQALACNMGGGGGGGAGGTGGAGGGSDIRNSGGTWVVYCPDTGTCYSLAGSGGSGSTYFGTTYANGGRGAGNNTGSVTLRSANTGDGGWSHQQATENTTGGGSGIVIVRWYA